MPTVSSGIIAVSNERYTASSNSVISTTETTVMMASEVSIAENRSDSVGAAPVKWTSTPGGRGSASTAARTFSVDRCARVDPTSPVVAMMRWMALPSGLMPRLSNPGVP